MAFQPFYGRNAIVVFGETETGGVAFQCQVRSFRLNPDVNIERIKTLCPDGQFADVDDPEWTFAVTYLQGSSDDPLMPALSSYLLEHMGEEQTVWVRPIDGGEGRSFNVTIVPGPWGVDQGAFSEESVDLPVEGQPEIIPETIPAGASASSDTSTTSTRKAKAGASA